MSPKTETMFKVNKVIDRIIRLQDNEDRKAAAKSIRSLLTAIDQEAEVVPESNPEMLARLIASLKGSELSIAEREIIFEIAGS